MNFVQQGDALEPATRYPAWGRRLRQPVIGDLACQMNVLEQLAGQLIRDIPGVGVVMQATRKKCGPMLVDFGNRKCKREAKVEGLGPFTVELRKNNVLQSIKLFESVEEVLGALKQHLAADT